MSESEHNGKPALVDISKEYAWSVKTNLVAITLLMLLLILSALDIRYFCQEVSLKPINRYFAITLTPRGSKLYCRFTSVQS
ncbi:hypothetical protein CKQ84_08335 [Shewanella sp. WE21]|nr:hypothetical protein CKQ84_08335 [Shewanella sp. WE21]